MGQTRHGLGPAISQVIDLVIALFLLLPESQVLLKELNDALCIAEVILLELINLIKSLLQGTVRQLTGLGVILEHLIVEDTEVQGEPELDRVASGKINGIGLLIGLLCLLFYLLELCIFRVLSDVAVVITDHLDKESLGLVGTFAIEDAIVDDIDNLLAIVL